MNSWPPDYVAEFAKRQRLILKLRSDPGYVVAAKAFYKDHPHEYIEHWGVTYDPRNVGTETPTTLPFILFQRQHDMIDWLLSCMEEQADGLEEKSRDMGATWLAVAFSCWLWNFHSGAAIGWGSRKQESVDKIGDPGSIFEKIRIFLRYHPRELLPVGFSAKDHMSFMKVINPENGATITGEVGDNIGRGGRTSIYFKDESAHYEHPESIEAALGDNTRVQIDISSVNGLGNVFQRRRENGVEWAPGQRAIKGKTNVFIMDWRDHPAKTQEWHDQRRAKAIDDGLLHVFASEVDRDYAASVEGVIIPAEWVSAAIDAHIKLDYLGDWDSGLWGAGLDVADEGLDRNAMALRRGPILKSVAEWGARDTGATTRKMIEIAREYTPIEIQYDAIGVGSGVKSEANRIKEEGSMPVGLGLTPWFASASPLYPNDRVVPPKHDDTEDERRRSPKNKDFYSNLKAQGWWELRRRFEKTYRAVQEGESFPVDELISIPNDMLLLQTARKELSQATSSLGAKLKLVVNKSPEGTKSPNIADAIVMAFWPIPMVARGIAVQGVQVGG